MKELVQAINRLAEAQEESNRINTELLRVLLSVQKAQQQNTKLLNQQCGVENQPPLKNY